MSTCIVDSFEATLNNRFTAISKLFEKPVIKRVNKLHSPDPSSLPFRIQLRWQTLIFEEAEPIVFEQVSVGAAVYNVEVAGGVFVSPSVTV